MTRKDPDFVHLHVHVDTSLLDGFGTVPEMVAETVRIGQPALAITDHGNMHGVYDLYTHATNAGIKPIAGIEAYMAPSIVNRKHRGAAYFAEGGRGDVSGRGAYTHITLLAENNEGLHNLYKMGLLSYTEGFFQKNRIDLELLEQYGKGIIATTGCPSGEIQTRLRLGQKAEAYNFAGKLQEVLGKENVFMELMEHEMKSDLERGVRNELLEIAKKLNIPLLATNDVHYTTKNQSHSHEEFLCVQTRSVMSTLPDHAGGNRFAFEGTNYYLKTASEMEQLFPDLPEALNNTLLIAERSNIIIEPDSTLRPKIDIPNGLTENEYLKQEAITGLSRRAPEKAKKQEYIDRLETEIGILQMKDYVGYFLVVSDFVRWAKNNGVPVGHGRGSAGGSLVAYCLDITDIDPIKYNLLFERFINPERDSPPDIDMDFNDTDRERVIEYVRNKYGIEQVAQIATFGKIGAKAAIKDSIRIKEMPYSTGEALSKALPEPVSGKAITLKEVYDPDADRYPEAGEFRDLVKKIDAENVIETARNFEGRIRSTGVHAAALVISSKPVVESVPMMQRQNDGSMITQWDYPTSEHLGLLKVDFLGLRNLGIIAKTIKHIEKTRNEKVDLYKIIDGDMDDPKTYQLLAKGDSNGVFQLDSAGLQSLMKQLKPTEFNDIAALLALYRPGPMGVGAHVDYALRKNGEQKVTPIHAELEEPLKDILGETYGLCIYQEEIMLIAQKVANYTLAQADNLRRAMGKKKKSVLDAEYVPFSEGMRKNGYGEESIKDLWNILVPFADYGFNKCVSDKTVIRMADGSAKSIREIYNMFKRGEEIYVQSMWSDGEVKPHKVANVVSTGMKEVYRLKTENGRTVDLTPEHRLLTTRGYLELQNIIVGEDELIVADEVNEAKPKVSRRFTVENLGFISGYGSDKYRMAEFLIENSIHFEMHKPVGKGECDFYFEGLYWEMDCMDRHISYFENKYGNIPFIVVTPEDYQERIADVLKLEHVRNGDLVVSIEKINGKLSTIDIEMAEGGPKNYLTWKGIVSHNSHSVGYGMLSYLTAYFKANYPAEFMSALLSSVADDSDKTALYLNDCRNMGITVDPPNVNESNVDYEPASPTHIHFGFKAIRGIGEAVAEEIVNIRGNRPFKDFAEFITRIPKTVANKRILEALALGGAFDSLKVSRKSVVEFVPDLLKDLTKMHKKAAKVDEVSLFDLTDEFNVLVPDTGEWSKLEKLKKERHALGLYVSGHPLEGLDLTSAGGTKIIDLTSGSIPPLQGWIPKDARPLKISGIVTSLSKKRTKKGETFALGTVEDLTGTIPFVMFPKAFKDFGEFLELDGVYQLSGFHRERDIDGISFTVDALRPLEFGETGKLSLRVKLTEKQYGAAKNMLMEKLQKHESNGEGSTNVIVSLKNEAGDVREEILEITVKASPVLSQEIRELFGMLSIGRWRKTE